MRYAMGTTIRVRGDKDDLERVANDLRAHVSASDVMISDVVTVPIGVLDRRPLGQFGLFELLVSFAANVASAALYDAVKSRIQSFRNAKSIEISESVTTIQQGDDGITNDPENSIS